MFSGFLSPLNGLALDCGWRRRDYKYGGWLRIFRIGANSRQGAVLKCAGGRETKNSSPSQICKLQNVVQGLWWILGTTQTMENGHGNWNLECEETLDQGTEDN